MVDTSAIDAAAAAWVVKMDRDLTPTEAQRLEQWLASDARCEVALERARATWEYAERCRVLPSIGLLPATTKRPRVSQAKAWALAASLLLGAVILFYGWRDYANNHLATALGEIRRSPLSDGSLVTLDTRSRVSVHYEAETRLTRLETGEALFEVAKNKQRPFVVQAGNVRVRAVGTAFLVRRRPDGEVEVVVTEGVVDVWRDVGSPEPAVRVPAGMRELVTAEEVSKPATMSSGEVARALAWTTGIIDLNGRTLGEAASEFNRYNRQSIVVADKSLAAKTLIGRFGANDPQAFVNAAAAMLGAHVRGDETQLILEPGSGARK